MQICFTSHSREIELKVCRVVWFLRVWKDKLVAYFVSVMNRKNCFSYFHLALILYFLQLKWGYSQINSKNDTFILSQWLLYQIPSDYISRDDFFSCQHCKFILGSQTASCILYAYYNIIRNKDQGMWMWLSLRDAKSNPAHSPVAQLGAQQHRDLTRLWANMQTARAILLCRCVWITPSHWLSNPE